MDTFSQIHRLNDVAEIQQLVRRFDFKVVYTQVSPGQLEAEAYEIRVGDCLVFREQYGCQLVAHGRSTPHGFGVMVTEKGVLRVFGNEVSTKEIVLFPPGCEIEAVGFPNLELVHYVLPKDRIAAAAIGCDVELIQAPRALVVEPGIDRLHRLQTLLNQLTEILETDDLGGWTETEQELVDTFLGLFDVASFRDHSPVQSNGSVTEHALEVWSYIHTCPLDHLDLDSLSRDLGVSRHHLNRCFREHYGVSVHEYVHLRRLHQARDLLAEPTKDLSVTETAYSCGFNHLGRFSTQYKRLFGETPRQTLGKAVQRLDG